MSSDKPDNIPFNQRLKTPKNPELSMVLNGVGNGMMIGAMPFVATELTSRIRGGTVSPTMHKFNAFATVAGCVLGGWYGLKEARQLNDYRQQLANEITNVEAKIHPTR